MVHQVRASTDTHDQDCARRSGDRSRLRVDTALKHRVRVRRCGGDELQDIPVLDELAALVEPKDVDLCVVVVAGPALVTVEDAQVTFGNRPFELDALTGILSRHALEVLDERAFAVSDVGVVSVRRCYLKLDRNVTPEMNRN